MIFPLPPTPPATFQIAYKTVSIAKLLCRTSQYDKIQDMFATLLSSTSNVIYNQPTNNAPSFDFLQSTDYVMHIILFASIATVVFLLLREVLCWYWKINDIKKLLEEIKVNTQRENKMGKDGELVKEKTVKPK